MDLTLVVLASASLSSFLSGLLGIGGALVLTPLLLYMPQAVGASALSVKLVTGLSIVQAISGSLFGLRRHHGYGHVSVPTLRVMGPSIAAASLVGALVSRDTSDRVLLAVFAALALLAAIGLLLPERSQDAPTSDLQVSVPLAVAIAVALGFFGGMVGIGGIAFIIPALIPLLRFPARVAIGTSLGVGFFGAAAALVGKAATAQIEPVLGALVFLSALVISPLGAAVSVRTPTRALTTVLAVIVVAAALRIAWSAAVP